MALSQRQDTIRLCSNPVEHRLNHVDLCINCISTHMADKTKIHEVVDFCNDCNERRIAAHEELENNSCPKYKANNYVDKTLFSLKK